MADDLDLGYAQAKEMELAAREAALPLQGRLAILATREAMVKAYEVAKNENGCYSCAPAEGEDEARTIGARPTLKVEADEVLLEPACSPGNPAMSAGAVSSQIERPAKRRRSRRNAAEAAQSGSEVWPCDGARVFTHPNTFCGNQGLLWHEGRVVGTPHPEFRTAKVQFLTGSGGVFGPIQISKLHRVLPQGAALSKWKLTDLVTLGSQWVRRGLISKSFLPGNETRPGCKMRKILRMLDGKPNAIHVSTNAGALVSHKKQDRWQWIVGIPDHDIEISKVLKILQRSSLNVASTTVASAATAATALSMSAKNYMAEIDSAAFKVGEAIPPLPLECKPSGKARHCKFISDIILRCIRLDDRARVKVNWHSGIHHFKNASFINVSSHKVELGGQDYGNAYKDKISGKYFLWSGQTASSADSAIHIPFQENNRAIHLFVRSKPSSSFVYWGCLENPYLMTSPTACPPRFKFEMQSFKKLKELGFPGL